MRITENLYITSLCGHVDGEDWVQLSAISIHPLKLVGSATITNAATDTPTLCDVYVHEKHRRTGIATELVRAAKRWADHLEKDLYLHVKPDNAAAQHCYATEGFEYTGEVKDDGSLWMIRCMWDEKLVLEDHAD